MYCCPNKNLQNDFTPLNSAKMLHFIWTSTVRLSSQRAVASTSDIVIARGDQGLNRRRKTRNVLKVTFCVGTACFDVFHRLNCWQWWGDRRRRMSLCGWGEEGKKKKSLVSRPGEREEYSDLFKHTFCFCNSLNTGNYIWLTSCYPFLSYTLWFDRFLQGLKGKLMLFTDACFLFCFVFNSWYLLMFLSISILTPISLFIWTLVVTSFIVSNRHRHYTLTAGSVVLHIIIVIVIITVLYCCFPLISVW